MQIQTPFSVRKLHLMLRRLLRLLRLRLLRRRHRRHRRHLKLPLGVI
jgi:hypothetical protein